MHGVLTENRLEWAKELKTYCTAKFADDSETLDVQHRRLVELRSIQRCVELDGLRAPEIDVDIVLQARARMAGGKCNGGGEAIVVEMIEYCPLQSCTFSRACSRSGTRVRWLKIL